MTFLVTGGAGGIGSAVCGALVAAGHDVVSVDRRRSSIGAVTSVEADLAHQGSAADALRRAAACVGSIEGVVNCVGAYDADTLDDFTWERFDHSLSVNLRAPLELLLSWVDALPQGATGRAINVISAAALVGSRDLGYAVAKTGLLGATRSLARSLSARGVLIFGIAPGVIDTPMSRAMPAARRQQHLESTLLQRAGRSDEVAELVTLLAAGRCDYLAGSVVNMSGGLAW